MKKKLQNMVKHDMFTLVLTLLVVCIAMTVLSDKFLTAGNLINVLRQSSQFGIMAIGMTMLILLGGIDLSVGSVQALAGVAAVWVLKSTNSVALAVLTGIAVGALIGVVNGLIITKMKITPLICTLGTMSIISGIALILTKAVSIQVQNAQYAFIGSGRVLGIPVPLIIMVVLVAVFFFVLNYTTFGRYIYAIGGNPAAARLAGIPVDRITLTAYVLSGCLTGLAAVILSSRLGSGQPTAGSGSEMTVIAAVIIGGVSLSGGKGSLLGAIIGVITLYVLTNGMVLLNVSSFWQDVMRGMLIILAVFIDLKRNERSAKALLQEKFRTAMTEGK